MGGGQQKFISFSFLHQTANVGGQRCLRRTGREAWPVQCQGLPLPWRQRGGRGRGVSCDAAPGPLQGTCILARTQTGKNQKSLARQPRAGTLCSQCYEPICFPRPWELLLCSSCAAEGTHRRCSGLRNSTHRWECDTCAGLGTCMSQSPPCPWAGGSAQAGPGRAHPLLEGWGHCSGLAWPGPGAPLTFLLVLTASRGESELSGSRLARQSRLESAHGFSESEAISPSSHTPVPLVLVSPSPSLETSSHRRRHHAARQQALPFSSLDTSTSLDSGPGRRRSRSRQQGRAQSPPVRSRSRRDRNSVTGPRAERPRQRETSSGPSPRRSRSRQQRRASAQAVRSRSRQDRSRRTAASAERPRRRGTRSGTSRRSSRSHQRRRTSTGTSSSST